jgi:hypothetical protein
MVNLEDITREVARLYAQLVPESTLHTAALGQCLQQLVRSGKLSIEGVTPSPSVAEELWAELQLGSNDQVTAATMIAKVVDFEHMTTSISMASTDDCDWITQYGLMHAALAVLGGQEIQPKE